MTAKGFDPRAGPQRRAVHSAWDPLLLCTAVLMVTAVARLHLLYPAFGLLRPVALSGSAAAVLFLLDRHPLRSIAGLRSPATIWLLGFTVWVALSVPGALLEGRGFTFFVDEFLKTVVMYALLLGAVRGPGDAERLAVMYFGGATVYALFVLTRFQVGGASWRLTELYTYDPNDFATFVVMALPLGIYFLARRGRWAYRLVAAIGCVALLAAFVWAGSRGGFLALLGAMAFLLIRNRAVSPARRLLLVAGIAAVVFVVASDRFWTQMATVLEPSADYNVTSETGRLNVWKRGLGYVIDRPLRGVGVNNFPVAEGLLSPMAERQQYGIGVRWTAPHNSFLQVAAEVGIPGLLLFLGMIAATFRILRRVERSAGDHRLGSLARALMASLIGYLIGAFFLSIAYAPMLYALVAVAVAIDKIPLRVPALRSRPAAAGSPMPVRVNSIAPATGAGVTRPDTVG